MEIAMSNTERVARRHEITDGWYVDDLTTVSECDIATSILTDFSGKIEVDLDYYVKLLSVGVADYTFSEDWCVRARTAWGYKRAALKAIERQRKLIHDTDRDSFFEFVSDQVGDDQMDAWRKAYAEGRKNSRRMAKASGPEPHGLTPTPPG